MNFIVIKLQLIINQFLKIKKIINLNDDIIKILEKKSYRISSFYKK